MAKKRSPAKREMRPDPSPKTIGDLRKLLSQVGSPWQPDPQLSDAEPMPQFPTGGDGTTKPIGKLMPKGRAIDAIRKEPPSNPHLRDVWIERGLLPQSRKLRQSRARKTPQRPDGDG